MKDSSSASPILSDRQRKFLGFVACFAGALLLGCLLASVILILNRAFDLFGGVIWSLAISGMLAILLRPIVTFLEEKIKLGRFSNQRIFGNRSRLARSTRGKSEGLTST